MSSALAGEQGNLPSRTGADLRLRGRSSLSLALGGRLQFAKEGIFPVRGRVTVPAALIAACALIRLERGQRLAQQLEGSLGPEACRRRLIWMYLRQNWSRSASMACQIASYLLRSLGQRTC